MIGLALLKMLALLNASLPSVALPTVTLPKRDLVLCFVCMLVGTVRLLHRFVDDVVVVVVCRFFHHVKCALLALTATHH